ncbi:MAG: hypothetical protein ACJ8AO_07300 [Gemmatimonadaceae bacterium]
MTYATPRDQAVTSDKNAKNALKNIDVVGVVEEGGTFAGKLSITHFGYDEATNKLLVSGVLNGFVTDENGKKKHVREEVTDVPATLSDEASVASAAAGSPLVRPAAAQTCDVLFLDLGPLFLDVLGLTVDLSEVILDINAVGGAGNLLGNLLCGLLSILDGFPILAQITTLLESINAILGGLGGLLGTTA